MGEYVYKKLDICIFAPQSSDLSLKMVNIATCNPDHAAEVTRVMQQLGWRFGL